MCALVNMKSPHIPEEKFNFGIRILGKRAVLQVDFVDRKIMLIQRGDVRDTFTFRQYRVFQKNEECSVTLHFTNERVTFHFEDADDIRILHYLINIISDIVGVRKIVDSSTPDVILPPQKIIKQYVVEKRGNTPIPLWDKRVLHVRQNEIAYFKPGGEFPLNVCRVWYENYNLSQTKKDELKLSVDNETLRDYLFRPVSGGTNTKQSQDDIKECSYMFRKAFVPKRYVLPDLPYTSQAISPNFTDQETTSCNEKEMAHNNNLCLGHLNEDEREKLGSRIQSVLNKIHKSEDKFSPIDVKLANQELSNNDQRLIQSCNDTDVSDSVFYKKQTCTRPIQAGDVSETEMTLKDNLESYPKNYRLTLAVAPTKPLPCAQKNRVKPPSRTRSTDD